MASNLSYSGSNRLRHYWLLAAGLLALFVIFHIFSAFSEWRGSSQLHTVMEVVATFLALLIGVLALLRYYSHKDLAILLVGTGFLGTAFLDGYHALVTSDYFRPFMPSDLPSLIPWSWVASRQYLSVFMVLSLFALRQENTGYDVDRKSREIRIYAGAIFLTLSSFMFFAFVPLPPGHFPEMFFHRPA